MAARMKVVVVSREKGPWELQDKDRPEVGPGQVIINGIALDEMTIPALPLVSHSCQIVGSAHNSLEYLAEALELVASGVVKPMVEVFPNEQVADACERAASGAVRFKAVVTYYERSRRS